MDITTQRLLLREFTWHDLASVYSYESDPRVVQYVCYGPYTEAECHDQLAFHIAHQTTQPRTFYHLALVQREEARLIGWCGLELAHETAHEAELGYALHRAYWGRGYMTEAANAMMAFGFQQLHLHRIFATCHPGNISSIRVLEKLGMRPEGHLRENKWCQEYWRDTLLFALLAHEWQHQ